MEDLSGGERTRLALSATDLSAEYGTLNAALETLSAEWTELSELAAAE